MLYSATMKSKDGQEKSIQVLINPDMDLSGSQAMVKGYRIEVNNPHIRITASNFFDAEAKAEEALRSVDFNGKSWRLVELVCEDGKDYRKKHVKAAERGGRWG